MYFDTGHSGASDAGIRRSPAEGQYGDSRGEMFLFSAGIPCLAAGCGVG